MNIPALLRLGALCTALALAGCGGGAGGASTCTLNNPGGCGGSVNPGADSAQTVDPATKAQAVSLVFSSNELASAGSSEVTVVALVKTADNTAVAGASVQFAADSGLLAAASAVTDASGKASARLGTGGAKDNRAITVSAKVGKQSASGVVNVVGTHLILNAPAALAVGASADLVATVLDSAGSPVSGATVSATTSLGNAVQPSSKASDSRGQVSLVLTASKRGSEQLSVSALGASASRSVAIGGSELALTPTVAIDASGAERLNEIGVGECAPIGGTFAAGPGAVSLAASRGQLYSDAGCTTALSGPVSMSAGSVAQVWICSANAGVSTIAAVAGAASASTRVEFVARLLPSSQLNVQPEQAVLGAGERSGLIAVVRDGSAANNLVKGATVQFSIVADPSGGDLLSPFIAVTGSDGVARAIFQAGAADGGKNGTVIEARVVEMPAASARTALTVNKKALSIQFGTGNTLVEFSPTILQQDFAVFVTDSAGNPVPGVTISAAAWPTMFRKGLMSWVPESVGSNSGSWQILGGIDCANEDRQRKGLYDAAYDLNNNGTLEPGIPLSVVAGGPTDAMGLTTVSLRYPRDRGHWVRVELTVSGTVAGTESQAQNTFWLMALARDMVTKDVTPPGQISPYGTGNCYMAD